jgi:probable HAF family extracellular repeat protein
MKNQFYQNLSMQSQIKRHRSVVGLISIGLIAFLAIGISTGQAQAPPPLRAYKLTDLGTLPAKKANCSIPAAINDKGQVTGTSGMANVDETAFLYDSNQPKGGLEDLSRNYGGISRGFGINAVGDVVGDSNFGTSESFHAALFRYGKIVDLGFLKGTISSQAYGINASGLVVGFCITKSADNRAFLWIPSRGMLDLPTLGGKGAQALAISDGGLITGTSELAESSLGQTTHAFIYNPFSMSMRNSMIDLGTLGGNASVGTAINTTNHVVGYSTLEPFSDFRVHAFLHDGTKMRDLGSLEKWVGADQSYALGVNNLDQVVGYSYTLAHFQTGPSDPPVRQTAFLYTNGQMKNLNDLVGTTTEPYWVRSATAINNNGQIVAIAEQLNTNELHAVLLTP